jgi:hypothetical protein
VEPYYPPTTESGRPALVEAAEKRLIAIQNVEKAREIQARLKLLAKPGTTGENTRTERKSRNETMLPLGVPPPGILGWRSDVSHLTAYVDKRKLTVRRSHLLLPSLTWTAVFGWLC